MKGIVCRQLYGELCNHRPSADEDILIRRSVEDLMENGVFGNTTQAQRIARSMTNAAVEKNSKKGSPDLLRAIFPNKNYLTAGYPELIEYPWLLPVCWVKRWMRHLKIGTQNKGNLVKESVEISSRKISLLKKYGIL